MNIAFIRLDAGPLFASKAQGSFGGAEVRAATFAVGLARRTDHRVTFCVREPPSTVTTAPAFKSVRLVAAASDGINGDPQSRPRVWRRCHKVSRSIRKRLSSDPLPFTPVTLNEFDVVCSFGLQNPTPSIVKSAQLAGIPSVVFLTSDADTHAALLGSGARQRDLRDHRFAILNASLVVAQTETQLKSVERLGQAVVRIKNPIDTKITGLVPIEKRRHMLWVGRADTDSKRADLLIELARMCPEVPFVAVMNPTDPRTTESLFRRIPDNVQLLERVGFEAIDRLYRDAFGLVNTSDSEGFPNAFLQAFKYGVPVLSRRVNPDGVLTLQQTGFVAGDDMSKLASMIRRLYDEPKRLLSVSSAARDYVVRYHEATERVDELGRLLQSLFHASRRFDRRSAA